VFWRGVQWEGETQTLREFVTGKEDLNSITRLEQGSQEQRERKAWMEFWITCHCIARNCQDLEVCENQSLRFYIVLETKGEGAEKASQWMCLMLIVWSP
jgi:hypothetical protein